MPHRLHVPGERPRALRWTVHDPRSRYGQGVLLLRHTRDGADLLDGLNFRLLRDGRGAWIETDDPARVRRALGVPADENLGEPDAPPDDR